MTDTDAPDVPDTTETADEFDVTDLERGEQITYRTFKGYERTADFVRHHGDGSITVSFVGYPDVAAHKTLKPKEIIAREN